jgi:fructose-specific phosphotransferase system IIC component
MLDPWIVSAACFAGLLLGFVAGVTQERAAGHITSGVSGFLAGALATGFTRDPRVDGVATAKLFIMYLACLLIMYIGGNVMRRNRWTDWFLGPPK